LAEVCLNRSLDDFARRTSNKTTLTGKLGNLLSATTSAGIAHHEDWIELATGALAIVHRFEHFLRHFVSDFRPDGDDFVVTFAICDNAVKILLFDSDNVLVSLVDKSSL